MKARYFLALLFCLLLYSVKNLAQDEIPAQALNGCPKNEKEAYFSCLDSLGKTYTSSGAQMQVIYGKCKYFLNFKQEDSVISYATYGIKLAKKDSNAANEAAFMSLIANANLQTGEFDEAIETYMQLISFADSTGDKAGAATIRSNVANIYIKLNDYESARDILREADKLFKETNDSVNTSATLGMIAFVNLKLKDTTGALDIAREALSMSDAAGAHMAHSRAAGVIAQVYYGKEMYDSSLYYYKTSLASATKVAQRYHIFMSKTGMMTCYYKLKEYGKAQKLAEELKDQVEKTSSPFNKIVFYRTYADILYYRGEYKNAFSYLRKAYSLNKQITGDRNKKIVNEIRTKYETEKKDKEIAENKLVMQTQEAELNKRNLYLAVLVFAIILLALIIILIRTRNRHKIQQLNEQKRLQVLNASVEGEEKERKRIARELHDSIANELAVIKMGVESLANDVDNDITKGKLLSLSEMANDAHKETRRISHNLHPAPSIRNRFAEAVKEYLESMPTGKSHTEVTVIKKSDIYLAPEKQLLIFRILQEMVGNALRHSNAKNIHVDLIINHEQINISVADDGDGIRKETLDNPETLSSIKENTFLLDGTIDIDSTLAEGTTIMISVPNRI